MRRKQPSPAQRRSGEARARKAGRLTRRMADHRATIAALSEERDALMGEAFDCLLSYDAISALAGIHRKGVSDGIARAREQAAPGS